ncbi:MAG: hypothetical protein Q9213_001220 [Squamulea squamosa]
MATHGSLHAKASAVLPKLSMKPTTIVVAILQADKDANGRLREEDFLWIKCHAKVSLRTIYQQYENKRQSETPWVLKYGNEPVSLELTVGDVNKFGNNIVAFEAFDKLLSSQVPSSGNTPSHTGNPLSPKDVNPRLRSAHVPPKPTLAGKSDENSLPVATPPDNTHNYHVRPSPRPDNTIHHRIHYDRLEANSPRPTPSPGAGSPYPYPRPSSHVPQRLPSASSATQPSLVKVPEGNFHVYCDAWIDKYRNYFSGESNDLLQRRLWNNWLLMRESERTRYAPSQQPAHVKTEVTATDPSTAAKTPAASSTPAASVSTTNDEGQKHFQFSALLKDATPQVLESSVEASVKLLETLRAPLADKMENNPDAEHWIQQIDNLKKLAVKTKTVIGVVGNTGAGKSSVINAMLEEERLVPTNCMRACTAVVTEISYNYEEQPYCAEIEFITAEDWAKELKVLFQDLLDGDGNVSRECTNEDSDAGVAYAKIKAVYPQKTKEEISHSTIDRLLNEVSNILGTRRNIKETGSLMFYRKLQSFVDSKEKSTGKKDKDGKKPKREREMWPLIRVVRLYVKSPALATGAVIVDLPGYADDENLLVAPINRAVDDKAAKSLLGESFKRQLKMDGGFGAVTFICSKTDDISISEAQDSLGLDEKMVPSWDELDRLSTKQKDLKKQLEELSNTKSDYEDIANDVDEQIEVWEAIETSVTDGKVTYPPKAKPTKKRKASSKERPTKQKRRKISSDDEEDDDFIDDGSDDNDMKTEDEDDSHKSEGEDHDSQDQQALTEEQVVAKLQELKATKKDARTKKREINEKVQDIRKELREIEDVESKINSEMSALCISGRNQYSKGAIQQDFAAGIKEIDQEIAAEEDEDNFNPETEVRNYDEVAKSLPVFCVSSRGYQKLKGRLRKEPPVPGFTAIEETEIPALQAHCEKLTETGRAASCRGFINRLSSLLNSLAIWASSDGTGANLTPEQKAREARYLQKGMEGLESRLEKVVKSCAQALVDELQDAIYDRYEAAVQAATSDSVETANRWGGPINRENRAAGGLYWSTSPGWEKVFTRRVGAVMTNFTKAIPALLKKFHRDIEDRARKIRTGLASLSMLSHQITAYEQVLKDAAATTKDVIVARQKDINREFAPVIERAMLPSYEWCEAETGSGQYKRMKAYMTHHIEANRNIMFQASADEIKRQLGEMVKDVEETLADKTDEVFMQIKRDYRAMLGGGDVPQGEVIPRVQLQVRRDIKKTIDGVERMMKIAVGLKVEDLPNAIEDADESTKSEADEDAVDAKPEEKELSASKSRSVKHEAADATPTQLQSSDSTISEVGPDQVPSRSEVKEEPEDLHSMGVSDPNTDSAGSDEANDSEGNEDDGEDLSDMIDTGEEVDAKVKEMPE